MASSQTEINLEAIALAMEDNRHYDEFFINIDSGDVIPVSRDIIDAVEDDDAESLSDNMGQMVSYAESFIFDPKTPLRIIPNVPYSEELRIISSFADQVSDVPLKDELLKAMRSNKPMYKCLKVLERYPDSLAEWESCKKSFFLEEAKKWVDSIGL